MSSSYRGCILKFIWPMFKAWIKSSTGEREVLTLLPTILTLHCLVILSVPSTLYSETICKVWSKKRQYLVCLDVKRYWVPLLDCQCCKNSFMFDIVLVTLIKCNLRTLWLVTVRQQMIVKVSVNVLMSIITYNMLQNN